MMGKKGKERKKKSTGERKGKRAGKKRRDGEGVRAHFGVAALQRCSSSTATTASSATTQKVSLALSSRSCCSIAHGWQTAAGNRERVNEREIKRGLERGRETPSH
jgi:hypothetical protein